MFTVITYSLLVIINLRVEAVESGWLSTASFLFKVDLKLRRYTVKCIVVYDERILK